MTATYVGKVREVRFLTADVAILRGVVGMVPQGKTDINPVTNAIQSLVAEKRTMSSAVTLICPWNVNRADGTF